MSHQIFLSYTSSDWTVAESLLAFLESQNLKCWVAPRDILPGKHWANSIFKAIKQSQILVVLVSSNSTTSYQVVREVAIASDYKVTVLPVLIEKVVVPDRLQYYLNTFTWVDASVPPFEKPFSTVAAISRACLKDRKSPSVVEYREPEDFEAIVEHREPEDFEAIVENSALEGFEAISLFSSYAHKDRVFQEELKIHLKVLQRQGVIQHWDDSEIEAGENWREKILKELERADIILMLISPDFMASDFCYEIEMTRSLQRHERGQARVIPIIIRDCSWGGAPFSKLQALPKEGKAINTWRKRDTAWRSVVEGIASAVNTLKDGKKP